MALTKIVLGGPTGTDRAALDAALAMDSQMQTDGFTVVPAALNGTDCGALASHIMTLANNAAGTRRLLEEPWCAELATGLREHEILRPLLPNSAVAVQCTLFDKSPDKNWLVSLHQDLSIPVKRRVDSDACTGWSEKEGQAYVRPPVAVLERLVAIRVHVDECTADNGPLRVVPGSHAFGR